MSRPESYDFLDDPAERAWLTDLDPREIAANAHRFYYFMAFTCPAGPDSFLRELAFEKAADALGISYDTLVDAWLYERPLD